MRASCLPWHSPWRSQLHSDAGCCSRSRKCRDLMEGN